MGSVLAALLISAQGNLYAMRAGAPTMRHQDTSSDALLAQFLQEEEEMTHPQRNNNNEHDNTSNNEDRSLKNSQFSSACNKLLALNQGDKDKALCEAAARGLLSEVKELLAHHADIDALDENIHASLDNALSKNKITVAKELFAHGATVDKKTWSDFSTVIKNMHKEEITEELMRAVAPKQSVDPKDVRTMLPLPTSGGHVLLFHLVVDYVADYEDVSFKDICCAQVQKTKKIKQQERQAILDREMMDTFIKNIEQYKNQSSAPATIKQEDHVKPLTRVQTPCPEPIQDDFAAWEERPDDTAWDEEDL